MINICFNGESISVDPNLSIGVLLQSDMLPIKNINSVAIVVNDHVLPRSKWDKVQCQSNDQIQAFNAVAGG